MATSKALTQLAAALLAVIAGTLVVSRVVLTTVEPETAVLLGVIGVLVTVIVVADRRAGDDRGVYAR